MATSAKVLWSLGIRLDDTHNYRAHMQEELDVATLSSRSCNFGPFFEDDINGNR